MAKINKTPLKYSVVSGISPELSSEYRSVNKN
jgi:hypothetical protein